MSLLGVDVYGGNAPAIVSTNINRPEVGFVIAKATEGRAFDDARYAEIRTEVALAGRRFGAYHFAWPSQEAIAEADHFLRVAAPAPGELVALDLEKDDGATWARRVEYALAWLTRVETALGVPPLVYVNWSWIKGLRTAATQAQWDALTRYPLWLADWNGTPGQHSTVNAKDGSNSDDWPIALHQYTNNWNGSDGDHFAGGYRDLDDIAVPKEDTTVDLTPILERLDRIETQQGRIEAAVTTMAADQSLDAQTLLSAVNATTGSVSALQSDVTLRLAGLAPEVSQATAAAASAAVTQSIDSTLGGVEVTARYVRQKEN